MWFPKLFISALDKIGVDAKYQFLIYFLPVMVYALILNQTG